MSLFNDSNKVRMEFCSGVGRFTAELNGETVMLHHDGTLELPPIITRDQFCADIESNVYGPI